MVNSEFEKCWNKSFKNAATNEFFIVILPTLLFITLIFLLSMNGVFGLNIFSSIPYEYLVAIYIVLIALIVAIMIIWEFYMPTNNIVVELVNCISAFYGTCKNFTDFEQFEWLVKENFGNIIKYGWYRYLVIPKFSTIALISPCKCDCENFHIGVKIKEGVEVFVKPINKKLRRYEGSGIKFRPLLCSSKDSGEFWKYKGMCCMCSESYRSKGKCIIDKIRQEDRSVLGVSLGSAYNKKYLAVYAKMPRSAEDFEKLLYFASDVMKVFNCSIT